MTTHTIDTTNSAGSSPCTPEAHQIANLKTADEMRSGIDTFKAELGNLKEWDDAALDKLWGWLSAHLITIEIEMNSRKG